MENWTGGDDTGRVSRPEPPLQASLRQGFPALIPLYLHISHKFIF